MKKTLIIVTAMLALTGCAQGESKPEDKQDSENIIQVVQPERKNANEFYVTEKGDGYVLMETGDGKFTQRWDYRFEDGYFRYSHTTTNNSPEIQYVENDAAPYLELSINNKIEPLPVAIPLYRGYADLESGASVDSREEGALSLEYYKEMGENPKEGSLNVWNGDGDNQVWLTIGGSFEIFKSRGSDEVLATYTYPNQTNDSGCIACFTFDKNGNLKSQ